MIKVMGVDPGSLNFGVGFLTYKSREFISCDGWELIRLSPHLTFPKKLFKIKTRLKELYLQQKPDVTVVERVFLGKNVDSAFKLGHVRGVCFALAEEFGNEVVEVSPKTVKKSITGRGSAEKEEVRLILTQLLKIKKDPPLALDVSDALASAYFYATQWDLSQRLKNQTLSL